MNTPGDNPTPLGLPPMPPPGAPGPAAELRRLRDRIDSLTEAIPRLTAEATRLEAMARDSRPRLADHYRRRAADARRDIRACEEEILRHRQAIPAVERRLRRYNTLCTLAVLLLILLTLALILL